MGEYRENGIYKLRKINSYNGSPTFGITIPLSVANNFSGAFFSIETTNNMIILTSGVNPYDKTKDTMAI